MKLVFALAIFLLTLLATACADEPTSAQASALAESPRCDDRTDFHFNPPATKASFDELERAAVAWNRHTVASRCLDFAGGDWRVVRDETPKGFNGQCDYGKKLVTIRLVPIGATVYAVALHEFGHAIGLQHVTRGVMDPEHVTTEFSPEDMAECQRVGACP